MYLNIYFISLMLHCLESNRDARVKVMKTTILVAKSDLMEVSWSKMLLRYTEEKQLAATIRNAYLK